MINCELDKVIDQLEMVSTPDLYTCEDVAKLLNINIQKTLKCLVFKSVERKKKNWLFLLCLEMMQLMK